MANRTIPRLLLAAIIAALFVTPSLPRAEAQSTFLTFIAVEDGDVTASAANTSGTTATVRRSSTETRNGLLRFDTSALPDNATITNASMSLWVTAKADDNNRGLAAEYYTAFPIDVADFSATSANNAVTGWDLTVIQAGAYANFPIQNRQNISLTGSTGFRLHVNGAAAAGDNAVTFVTSEGASNQRPKLVVTYTVDAPTPTPTQTGTPTLTPTATNTPVPPTPTNTPTPPPGGAASIILDKWDYDWSQLQRGIQDGQVAASVTAYRPRQFVNGRQIADDSWGTFTVSDAGPYAGWDYWTGANRGDWRAPSSNQQWARFTLQRAARVALVWRGKGSNPPAWLTASGWTEGATIATTGAGGGQSGTHRVFTKDMPAGAFWVPWVGYQAPAGANNNTWWVLFAETGGVASSAPTVPPGQTTPVPNETCPQWVHDSYTATGPDGQAYATWHRVIDPVYWCYHRHEHGTDPALLGVSGFKPTFNLAASADGATEPHWGFKVMVWKDRETDHMWLAVTHLGTGTTGAACNRYHEVGYAVALNGQLKTYVQYQADFGEARSNNLPDIPANMQRHPNCPAGYTAPGSTGRRFHPHTQSINGSTGDPIFYYPWRTDQDLVRPVLGVYVHDDQVNTPDVGSICNNQECAVTTLTGKPGAQRFRQIQESAEIVAPAHVDANGYFWTNAKATQVVAQGTLNAVRQFVQPGLVLAVQNLVNTEAITTDAIWGTELDKVISGSTHGASRDPERSISQPN